MGKAEEQKNIRRIKLNKSFLLIIAILTLFGLTACGTKDVDYYKAHPEEMNKKHEECKKMSIAEAMADRECVAASQAFTGDLFKSNIPRPGEGQGRGTKKF